MGSPDRWDLARQVANVTGALFQVGATGVASPSIQAVVGEGPPSLVEPAGYAFAIWAPIFGLSLAYAVYQARPSVRRSPLLRRIGWLTAGAFTCTGLWSVLVPRRELLGAQAMLLGIALFLALAYLRLVRTAGERDLTAGERWLVALPLAPFFGWVTAANAVSLTSQAVGLGLVEGRGPGEALLGLTLLLLGGALASAVVLAGKDGPPHAWLTYGATVLWALVAIIINQYEASTVTVAAAAGSAVLVALALLRAFGRGRPRRRHTPARVTA